MSELRAAPVLPMVNRIPTSPASEAVGRLETRPCACGGTVTADPNAPAKGVAAHQFTGRHKAWRSANGLEE